MVSNAIYPMSVNSEPEGKHLGFVLTFRVGWNKEEEMEELVGKVESACPKVVTLRTQVSL